MKRQILLGWVLLTLWLVLPSGQANAETHKKQDINDNTFIVIEDQVATIFPVLTFPEALYSCGFGQHNFVCYTAEATSCVGSGGATVYHKTGGGCAITKVEATTYCAALFSKMAWKTSRPPASQTCTSPSPSRPPTPTPLPNGRVYFQNTCNHRVRLALSYQNMAGVWEYLSWWGYGPNTGGFLRVENRGEIRSNNSYFYYYAETTDGSNIVWKGNTSLNFNGTTLTTRERQLSRNTEGNWVISINCNN